MILLVVAAVFLTRCGGGAGGGNGEFTLDSNVNGSWSGVVAFHNTVFPTNLNMFITQSGAILHSPIVDFSGLGCNGSGSMSGSISGGNISMTIAGGGSAPNTTTISATSYQGHMNGTFTTSGGCDGGDQGTFDASLIPPFASSMWSGAINPTGIAIPLTADINEDQMGNLTGTVSLTGLPAPCNTAINIIGTQIGRQMHISDSQGFLNAYGSTDPTVNAIAGNASGSCVPSGSDFSMSHP